MTHSDGHSQLNGVGRGQRGVVNIAATEFHSRRGNLKILNLGDIGSSRPWVKGWDQGSQCLFEDIVFIPSPSRKTFLLRSEVRGQIGRRVNGVKGSINQDKPVMQVLRNFRRVHAFHTK